MRGLKINKQAKGRDIPLSETPTPDFRYIPNAKKGLLKDKPYTATAEDSTQYKEGFKRKVEGGNKWFPSRLSTKGYKEAKDRGY